MNVFTTSSQQFEKIAKWCELGLEHRVHFRNSEGMLEEWYQNPSNIRAMSITFYKGEPIGIAVVLKRGWRPCSLVAPVNVGVYTKSNYRRHGIGTELVRRCERLLGYSVRGDAWNPQADAFYRSVA
jgi:GNAT superfamily N-acetyltransferase